jgi:NAD(P)-dependent dehydrogenase (short-subunit alcohol dehydrogenase family)
MLRWHLWEGRSVIPKSTRPHRIAENFDVFDFDLADDELAAIDALDTDQRGGPVPDDITDRDSIVAAAKRIQRELGGADVLVNNQLLPDVRVTLQL